MLTVVLVALNSYTGLLSLARKALASGVLTEVIVPVPEIPAKPSVRSRASPRLALRGGLEPEWGPFDPCQQATVAIKLRRLQARVPAVLGSRGEAAGKTQQESRRLGHRTM